MPGFDPARPPRTHDGHAVWRVKVAPDEVTCTVCGDPRPAGQRICYRCNEDDDDATPPSVPTVSYLRPHEFELVR